MTTDWTLDALSTGGGPDACVHAWYGLVIAWSRAEPERVGEVALVPSADLRTFVLGRETSAASEDDVPLPFRRPGPMPGRPTGGLGSTRISRRQLQVRAGDGGLLLRNLGRCPLRLGGETCDEVLARPGDLVELRNELLLLCVQRPEFQFTLSRADLPMGGPDAAGMVGESAAAWRLRDDVRFVAGSEGHTLILGPSGAGKELVAAALHRASARGRRAWVARNAATLPDGLVDAELFGNVRSYPNPGMPERRGLVGEADGTTLFLDEIGELPAASQAHLLRVLDSGEYQRLGARSASTSDFRLLAATNRPIDELKHDLAARFPLRVVVPGLDQRPDDVPLLAAHLLRSMAKDHPEVAIRAFPDGDPSRPPLLGKRLVAHLVTRAWSTHVRELEQILWEAVRAASAPGLEQITAEQPMVTAPAPAQPVAESRAGRLLAVLVATAAGAPEGLVLEVDPGGRRQLLVCLSDAARLLTDDPEFGGLSPASLARVLGDWPGLRNKRLRRRDLRDRRWWQLDLAGLEG